MAKLVFDQLGKRFYETGTRNGVLFVVDPKTGAYGKGVSWNGLVKVNEKPDGAEESAFHADDIKYLSLFSAENFKATIEAYTYPDEFEACDGSSSIIAGATVGQQTRSLFGFAYKTILGNDLEGNDYGFKLHLIYGAKASPSEREYESVNKDPNAATLSWDITTSPIDVPGFKPTANLTFDSTVLPQDTMKKITDLVYGKDPTTTGGTDGNDAKLPLPSEIISLLNPAGH